VFCKTPPLPTVVDVAVPPAKTTRLPPVLTIVPPADP
jgi:hypothetical protein